MCLWQMNPRKRQNPQKTADESDQKSHIWKRFIPWKHWVNVLQKLKPRTKLKQKAGSSPQRETPTADAVRTHPNAAGRTKVAFSSSSGLELNFPVRKAGKLTRTEINYLQGKQPNNGILAKQITKVLFSPKIAKVLI